MGSQPAANDLHLLPWPASVDLGGGLIRLAGAGFEPVGDHPPSERLRRAAARLGAFVARRCGLTLSETTPLYIRHPEAGGSVPPLKADESYWLVADDAGLFVDAASEWGVLRALATLAQLVSPEGTIRHIAVDDRPRLNWRGLLLDPARHFLPMADLKRTIDGMALCKLNVLHLHLSDDQGFRLPVPALPKLASRDAYTAGELAELVGYAADRGIRVVPEIDMPGHVTSWLTAYPELGCRQVPPTERFGVHGACLDPSREAVYEAVGCILDALVGIFPDPCLHLGGDEVSPGWWSEDPNVLSLMQREGLADARAVQGYFNRRVGRLAAARGRQVVAWDEVLDAGCPPEWIVQAWRGATARDRALAAGHPVVVSAPYYLDLNYPVDVHYGCDPAASQTELIASEDALLDDPRFATVAEGMRWTHRWREQMVDVALPADRDALLGAEACLWGELVTPAVLDGRLWSRLPALAERFWSAEGRADVHDRLDHSLEVLLPVIGIDPARDLTAAFERLGIHGEWRAVAGLLEPVKWYGRLLGAEALAARIEGREMPQARPYDLKAPLDRLVDHLPPESRPARAFAALCRRAGAGDEAALNALERTLAGWRRLAAAPDKAPEVLRPPIVRLVRLAGLIEARIAGNVTEAGALEALAAPMDELVIALPPSLCAWLTRV